MRFSHLICLIMVAAFLLPSGIQAGAKGITSRITLRMNQKKMIQEIKLLSFLKRKCTRINLFAHCSYLLSQRNNIDLTKLPERIQNCIRIIRSISNCTYEDRKAVKCLIKLVAVYDYCPSIELLNQALLEAALVDDVLSVQLLLDRGANPCFVNEEGFAPLTVTADKEIIKFLLAHHADINYVDAQGGSCLFNAILNEDTSLIDWLLHECNPDTQIWHPYLYQTPVSYTFDIREKANAMPKIALLARLLDHDADPNWQDYDGNTLLMIACCHNQNIEAVRLLLDSGARVTIDAQDTDGATALMNTAYYGYHDIAALLLEYGANPQLTDYSGSTAAELAEHAGFADLATLIKTYISKNPTLKALCERFIIKNMRLFTPAGLSILPFDLQNELGL